MAPPIPPELRQLVSARAGYRCEYCLLPQAVALHRHEPDHIVPIQIGSFDPLTGLLTPLFHPRLHLWNQHFRFVDAEVKPLTPEGRVTVRLLRLNDPDRLAERQRLIAARLYW